MKLQIFYYSGTHWDREWYQTFQGFRKRLVDMTDGLIDGLKNTADYGIFHFDGQTIVLEDYLEIRPEMKDELSALIKVGKIVIGPWYVMPDEFLISGESIIRNLRRGMKISREWGVEPAHNAYICDIFGHAAQSPQIFSGMGLYNTILGRGTNDGMEKGHFVWEALDGTQIIAFKERDNDGYGDFNAFIARVANELEGEELDKAVKEYVDKEVERSGIPLVLLMDALDHQCFRTDTGKYLESLRRVYPDAEVHHCSIEEFDEIQKQYKDKLEVRRGELCRPSKALGVGYNHVIAHTLSSRYPLKKYNDINQTRLEKWASPIYAFGKTDIAKGFLSLAEKYLIQNHPHDSICGCSIDQVHKDMIYRFDQTSQLCDEIINPFIESLASDDGFEVLEPRAEGEGLRLRIFNPLPYKTTRTVVARVDLEKLKTHYREPFGYEEIPSFRLYDKSGKELVYGYTHYYANNKYNKSNFKYVGDVYDISFECTLDAATVTEFYIEPSEKPTRNTASLLASPTSAEGDYISLSINPNGTVNITDKRSGEVYKNLLTLIDDGEIGDGWFHASPISDTLFSPNSAEISVVENNPVRVTFRIAQSFKLPSGMIFTTPIRRSENTVDYTVYHEVSLAKADTGITVHTYTHNNACDHRLRMRLPKTAVGDTYEASQYFGYVTRTCGDDPTTSDWKEYCWADRNTAGICAKRAGNRGLAFISAYGIHECGVWQNGDMDITLFRCFDKMPNGMKNSVTGQLIERLDFNYRIMLYTGEDSFAELQREQDFFAAGLAFATVEGGKAISYRPTFEVVGKDIVYTTANALDDGAEIRVFNDSEKESKVQILLPSDTKSAALTELDGRIITVLDINEEKVSFTLPAFRIATVKFN